MSRSEPILDAADHRWARARSAERQLAATVDELTEAQTENERLNGYLIDAFDQRDAAQAAREQAEAQRDRALEQLAVSEARSKDRLDAARWMSDQVDTLRRSLDKFLGEQL